MGYLMFIEADGNGGYVGRRIRRAEHALRLLGGPVVLETVRLTREEVEHMEAVAAAENAREDSLHWAEIVG